MKVLVLGGYGNFGARIVRALAGDPRIEVVVCGRDGAWYALGWPAFLGVLLLFALMLARGRFPP